MIYYIAGQNPTPLSSPKLQVICKNISRSTNKTTELAKMIHHSKNNEQKKKRENHRNLYTQVNWQPIFKNTFQFLDCFLCFHLLSRVAMTDALLLKRIYVQTTATRVGLVFSLRSKLKTMRTVFENRYLETIWKQVSIGNSLRKCFNFKIKIRWKYCLVMWPKWRKQG